MRFGRVATPERRVGVAVAGREFAGWFARPGVPHFVIETASLAHVPLAEWGAALRRHSAWGAEGANVDFCELRGLDRVGMRTFERGVEGETPACGSGAIATALARAATGAASPVRVETAGGDTLTVRWQIQADEFEVWLAGPAEVAFTGQWTVNAAAAVPAPQ